MRYGRSVEEGFLPVFAVDTEEEAKSLLVLCCQKQRVNGKLEFIAKELLHDQSIENLEGFGERLKRIYYRYIKKGEK